MQDQPPMPPPVYIAPSEVEAFFADYPVIFDDKKKFVVLGISAFASHDDLESAKMKLSKIGWSSEITKDREGNEFLLISTKHKSLDDTRSLSQETRIGSLGPITLKPYIIPAPDLAK